MKMKNRKIDNRTREAVLWDLVLTNNPKNVDYYIDEIMVHGRETLGLAVLDKLTQITNLGRDITLEDIESVFWYAPQNVEGQPWRKRYITKIQASKVYAMIGINSHIDPVESAKKAKDLSQDIYALNTLKALMNHEDIFFSDSEKEDILKHVDNKIKVLGDQRDEIARRCLSNFNSVVDAVQQATDVLEKLSDKIADSEESNEVDK